MRGNHDSVDPTSKNKKTADALASAEVSVTAISQGGRWLVTEFARMSLRSFLDDTADLA